MNNNNKSFSIETCYWVHEQVVFCYFVQVDWEQHNNAFKSMVLKRTIEDNEDHTSLKHLGKIYLDESYNEMWNKEGFII